MHPKFTPPAAMAAANAAFEESLVRAAGKLCALGGKVPYALLHRSRVNHWRERLSLSPLSEDELAALPGIDGSDFVEIRSRGLDTAAMRP